MLRTQKLCGAAAKPDRLISAGEGFSERWERSMLIMKKSLIAAMAAVFSLLMCMSAAAETELFVFAAASMTETLTEIRDMYEEMVPDIRLVFNFDSSGTLKTQIEEGADCDVFISAGQKQMNELDISVDEEQNPDRLDYVKDSSRINLLENKVTLVVPEDNPKGIESFEDLTRLLRDGEILMAMGNADVPVGQYTQKILAWYGLDEEKLAADGKISYGSNVKEVTTQVLEGSVDCGVVYCTDAFSAGLEPVDSATAKMCGQVIYPAAVIKYSEHPDEAQAFLDYLCGDKAMAVFERVGFSSLSAEESEELFAETERE